MSTPLDITSPIMRKKIVIVPDKNNHPYVGKPSLKNFGRSFGRQLNRDRKDKRAMIPYAIPYVGPYYKLAKAAWGTLDELDFAVLDMADIERLGLKFPYIPNFYTPYIMHPLKANQYYPVSTFHQRLMEEKFSELINLLGHLGATTIHVEHGVGASLDWVADISVPQYGSAKVSGTRKANQSLVYSATLDGAFTPTLPPEDKLCWYDREERWKMVALNRLESGTKTFTLALEYRDDFGVNAELFSRLKKYPVELGMGFHTCKSTRWDVFGSFL